jgi:thiamine-phosphate diphosphorylase
LIVVAPIICLVTDRKRYGSEERLVETIARAARDGVHLVQVRERDMDDGPLTQLVARCVAAVGGTRARVLVNDRADVALAAGAHGVHLPAAGVSAARLRGIVPAGFLIGRSVHGSEEAQRVCDAGGLDYLIFGTVFPTSSKAKVVPAGLDALRETVQRVRVPVLAIGGVTAETLPRLRGSGAAGFAAIGFFAGGDIEVPADLTF